MEPYTVTDEEYSKAKKDFVIVERKFNDLECSWGGSHYSEKQLEVMKEWDRIGAIIGRYEMEHQAAYKGKFY